MPDHPALDTLAHALAPDGFGLVPGRGLFLFARPHAGLADWGELTGWQPWRQHADAWENDDRPRVDRPMGNWPLVLALPGKSRDETLATFAAAYDRLETGGVFVAAMANDSGAARFEKELASAAGAVESIQKNKCRAFLARRDGGWNAEKIAAWRELATPIAIPDTPLFTVPGIFSAGRVDAGSALLAAHLPPSLHGRVADLGAGWGFLSHAILTKCPRVRSIDLLEADARALAMARENLTALGTSGELGFHWHDVTTGLPAAKGYDTVVMNPPFHDGKRTDISLGDAFLATAAAALRPGGTLLMVANRQLPYEATLTRLGLHPRVVMQDATFKILTAR
ncbi:MAG: class I SAM-dependent methyltransferase [Luteolibacter sp.]